MGGKENIRMSLHYLQVSKVRARVNENGKRVSEEFLLALDDMVRSRIDAACRVHNGGRKTLDAPVLGFVTGRVGCTTS
jgi:hypothetical protein